VTKAWFLTDSAKAALADIYYHTYSRWGEDQAEKYTQGLFNKFEAISLHQTIWRPIAPEYGVSGFFTRYGRHFIFWRQLSSGQIGIAAVLHDAMIKGDRLVSSFGELPPN
jgi:toxin ParE1/3/4